MSKEVPQPHESGGVGVVDAEARADQVVHPVYFGAFHILQRHVIDQHIHPVAGENEVTVGLCVVNRENMRKAGTSAALHGDAQFRAGIFRSQNFADSGGGGLRDGELRHGL